MPSSNKEKFLEEVLSHIKFPFDREAIKFELECHLLDKIDFYTEQGYKKETAEMLSIKDMGDADEIGIKLNKQHNPFLGWIWKLTNIMVILFSIWLVYLIGSQMVLSLFRNNPIHEIPKSDIVYKIEVDKKIRLDDTILHFTNVIYDKNGDLSIFYEYYDTKLWGTGWSLSTIGNLSDNLGNTYWSGSGGGGGGIKPKYRRTVENFPREADTLIISYDSYNRKFKVEIPLQVGDNNE